MRNKRKNEFSIWRINNQIPNTKRGITLVALVVTVIIVLILAGTAISISVNGGNLFEKSQNAVIQYNSKVKEEETTTRSVQAILGDLDPEPVKISTNYPMDWNDKDQLSGVAEAGGRMVPIPDGFVVSDIQGENIIQNGLVIYEGTDNVSTDESAITTRNQFVWIPVDNINQMVMCKDNNKNNDQTVCNLVLQNDGSLKCMTHHAGDNDTELCGRIYVTGMSIPETGNISQTNLHIYQTNMKFNLRNQKWNTDSYHEPDTLTDSNNGDASTEGIEGINRILNTNATLYDNVKTAWKDELTTSFKKMAESTAKYGGFYIARYESGYDSLSYTSKKGQVIMNADTTINEPNKGAETWYGLYKYLKSQKGKATSSMIWGCQYDQVINFIGQEAQIGHADRDLQKVADIVSGAVEKDCMKNIYDLEGNYWEWTALSYEDLRRTGRGSCYSYFNMDYCFPASSTGNTFPTATISTNSSRAVLYF